MSQPRRIHEVLRRQVLPDLPGDRCRGPTQLVGDGSYGLLLPNTRLDPLPLLNAQMLVWHTPMLQVLRFFVELGPKIIDESASNVLLCFRLNHVLFENCIQEISWNSKKKPRSCLRS